MAEKEITFDTGRARYSYTSGEQNRHGEGGQAELFIGTNLDTQQKVAIRLIDLKKVVNATIWFQREKNFIGNLKHTNIVEVLDYYESTDNLGRPFGYIIQEFIHGDTLAKKMKDWHNSSQPTQHRGEEQFQIMMDALSGLDYLHRNRIIHRDISPNNIMVADNGHVKIIDFGLAKDVNDTTMSYTVVAPSPGIYSPPEMGTPNLAAHPTMDIYAIAVVFYEMLAGLKLYSTRSIPLSKKPTDYEFSGQLEEHPNIHPQLLSVLRKAADIHAERRFQAVQEFQQALLAIKDQVLREKIELQNSTKPIIPKQETKLKPELEAISTNNIFLLRELIIEMKRQYTVLQEQGEELSQRNQQIKEALRQTNISLERRNELQQAFQENEEVLKSSSQQLLDIQATISSLQNKTSTPHRDFAQKDETQLQNQPEQSNSSHSAKPKVIPTITTKISASHKTFAPRGGWLFLLYLKLSLWWILAIAGYFALSLVLINTNIIEQPPLEKFTTFGANYTISAFSMLPSAVVALTTQFFHYSQKQYFILLLSSIPFILYSAVMAGNFWTINYQKVQQIKNLLLFAIAFDACLYILLIFLRKVYMPSLSSFDDDGPELIGSLVVFVMGMIFNGIWYLYLVKSDRVKILCELAEQEAK